MPPADHTPAETVRYFTSLLCALCLEGGGELRIPRQFVRKVEEAGGRQAIFEDLDAEKDEIVLRFGSKNSAVYPVEPCPTISKAEQPTTESQPTPPSIPKSPLGRPPLTDAQLAQMERKGLALANAARLRRQRVPPPAQ